MDEKKKVIFVERGKKLSVECLVDRQGKGFFLVTDENKVAMVADEIVVGDHRFSADQNAREVYRFSDQAFFALKDYLATNKVSHMLVRDIAKAISNTPKLMTLSPSDISKICKSLGMRVFRTAEGFAVSLKDEDLKQAEINLQNYPKE